MTKGELRKARRAARATGQPLIGELALARGPQWRVPRRARGGAVADPLDQRDRGREPCEFSESRRGYRARERWARRYDALNGRPEGPWDY